ncbi:hypothetical protein ACMDCR_31845 [Labrys okinawensis]|uniref:hypothetical protein n=1 Tax=Labrys okinawensis TaxID=346911 RepID=UPI0039BD0B9E
MPHTPADILSSVATVTAAEAITRAPTGELADIDDIRFTAALPASPFAPRPTGMTAHADRALSIIA